MFVIDRRQLIENLKVLRRNVCCYMNSDLGPCDCKFGPLDNWDKTLSPTLKYNSENTGCPELRETIMLLEKMSDEDFENYLT
jgi:hypothetical protein